ncbi:hypothetical protein FOA52_012627 [Chlamydomonas sp. UWO 241]|nr:hypothetical protein FOA52_012627 [Chlamydomonas sp. UWO 241]
MLATRLQRRVLLTLLLQLVVAALGSASEQEANRGDEDTLHGGAASQAALVVIDALNTRGGEVRASLAGVQGDVQLRRSLAASVVEATGGVHHRLTLLAVDEADKLWSVRALVWAPDAGPWQLTGAGATALSSEEAYNEWDHHGFHGEDAKKVHSMHHHEPKEVHEAAGMPAADTEGGQHRGVNFGEHKEDL